MLFNSYIFILAFLPVTLLVYFLLNRYVRFVFGKAWLVLMSFVFYAYFNPAYLPIILISIGGNYLLSQGMLRSDKAPVRKLLFAVGLIGNLGVLGYYKYYDFFATNVNALFGTHWILLRVVLPLGISFFTFQQLSYVIDSYRRRVPRYKLVDYALFVTFFPQLIAGPIVLHSETVPQFEDPANRHFNYANFAPGIYAFAIGLAKKVLIADTFAKVAGYGFAVGRSLNAPEALFVILAFTFQLYFDFSGYCDMALGLGKMFNINIPINFNSPYKSLNIQDFWKRWHITLSRFFTTYVYFPLGGSRKGTVRTCINLMIVFLVSGLWHGADWLFILWGAMHGAMSVIYRLFRKKIDALHPAFNWLLTFSFVALAWVFFAAGSVQDATSAQRMDIALNVIRSLFRMDFGAINATILEAFALPAYLHPGYSQVMLLLWYVGAFVLCLGCKNTYELTASFKPNAVRAVYSVALLFVSILSLSGVSVFLYYNF